ncbi:DUF937 domain-containing protein [Deinococcus murrayi]|uniref:DUF937 domain-containing protein n=1 Tax=Deinococcus murrayi TaxID=68910 RepID=UPI000687A373|nr:DUF937 domain-containing protein [Deinococcus murrayi]
MTVKNPLVSFFGSATPALGQAAGLPPAEAERVLAGGLPVLLRALADADRTPEGRAALDQAYAALPRFASAEVALSAPGGAAELRRAGEGLAANVLREPLPSLAARLGTAEAGTRLLPLVLPLLLSWLAGQGKRPAELLGAVGEEEASRASAAAGLSAAGLMEVLRGRLGGTSGEALARAAGFTSSTAGRAAGAAVPVLLAAVARRGQDEAGAADLLARSRDLEDLAAGPLPTDPAEVARLEGQGRPLVTHLFGSAEAVTGRLGSVVGGSGASAGKLLALLAPVVLGVLGREVRGSRATAADLRRVLGDLPELLPGLIPPGMPSLSALLSPPAAPPARTAAARPAAGGSARPAAAPPPQAGRRGGFPGWLLPLLLVLGGGGYWLTQQASPSPASSSSPAASQPVRVTTPAPGATLPAEPFVMSGTAAPGITLTISEGADEVATATANSAGNWEAQLPAPAPGEHTYTLKGSDGTQSEFGVSVVLGAPATN